MGMIHNALPAVMGRHRIKQAALAEAAGIRYATLNNLYNGKTERVDFTTLAAVLDGLHALTGRQYTVADLLEYAPATEDNAETRAVLADHTDILERTARLERGESRLIPIEEVAAKHGVKL